MVKMVLDTSLLFRDSCHDFTIAWGLLMRLILKSLLTGVLFALATSAQGQQLEPALEEAATARSAARVAQDGEAWGRYTADNIVVIRNTGDVLNKSQRIAAIDRGEGTEPDPTERARNVQRHGDAVIITTTYATEHITNVWVQENNRWLVAHVQFTPIE